MLKSSTLVTQGRATASQHLAPITIFFFNMLTLWTVTSLGSYLKPPSSPLLLYLYDLATFVKLPKKISGIHLCSAKCYRPSLKDSQCRTYPPKAFRSLTTSCGSCRGYAWLAFNVALATAPSLQGAFLYQSLETGNTISQNPLQLNPSYAGGASIRLF